jgi:hypothetical protein
MGEKCGYRFSIKHAVRSSALDFVAALSQSAQQRGGSLREALAVIVV